MASEQVDERRAGLARWVPGVGMLRTYRASWLRPDIVAGVVLAAILVPQGMAYAELAGLPPVTGLYTTIACLVGYALMGPSRILVLGPDSSVSPLIFAAIAPLLAAGDPDDGDRARRDDGAVRRGGSRSGSGSRSSASWPTCSRRRCRSAT